MTPAIIQRPPLTRRAKRDQLRDVIKASLPVRFTSAALGTERGITTTTTTTAQTCSSSSRMRHRPLQSRASRALKAAVIQVRIESGAGNPRQQAPEHVLAMKASPKMFSIRIGQVERERERVNGYIRALSITPCICRLHRAGCAHRELLPRYPCTFNGDCVFIRTERGQPH